jgi:hypothetical protein
MMHPALIALRMLLPFPAPAAAADSLPPVGIAQRDTTGGWCAAVGGDPLAAGGRVTLVFAAPDAPRVAAGARVLRRRSGPCHSEFPQLSLEEQPAYDLAADSAGAEGDPWVALVVAGGTPWRRGPHGEARADLDGDGRLEQARVCAADEGEHFTIWTLDPDGGPRRRWHGYYDWGALVDPTCGPGEDGR